MEICTVTVKTVSRLDRGIVRLRGCDTYGNTVQVNERDLEPQCLLTYSRTFIVDCIVSGNMCSNSRVCVCVSASVCVGGETNTNL